MPARDPSAPTHITVPPARSGSISHSYIGSYAGSGLHGAQGMSAGQGPNVSADLAQLDQNTGGGGPLLPRHRQEEGTMAARQNLSTLSPNMNPLNGNASPPNGPGSGSQASSSNWSRAPGYSHIHTGQSLGRHHGYGSFGQRLGQGFPGGAGTKRGLSEEGKSPAGEEQGKVGGFVASLLRRVSGDGGASGREDGDGDEDQEGVPDVQPAPMEAGRAGGDLVAPAGRGSINQAGDSVWSAWGSRRGSITDDYAPPLSPADLLSKSHAAIRDSTNRLASLSFSRPRRRSGAGDSGIYPSHLPPAGTPSNLPSPFAGSSAAPTPNPERGGRAFSPRSPPSPRASPSPSRGGADRARRRSSGVGHRPLVPSQLGSLDGGHQGSFTSGHGHGLLRVTEAEDVSPPKSLGNSRSGLSLMLDRDNERRATSTDRLSRAGERSEEDVKVGEQGYSQLDPDRTPMPRHQVLAPTTDSTRTSAANSRQASFRTSATSATDSGDTTPKAVRSTLDVTAPEVHTEILQPQYAEDEEAAGESSLRRYLAAAVATDESGLTERTSLLGRAHSQTWYGQDPAEAGVNHERAGWWSRLGEQVRETKRKAGKVTARQALTAGVVEPVKLLPAVILGSLLNVLDGVSYGMILFPANSYFLDFGSLGVSMFFVTCIISQLIFTLGGSIFPGGNGSMMIEAVPFFHILVNIIESEIGDDPASIIATTMVSFAFSSILTGIVFYALGAFKLGGLIGYFPRHILVGCIGGVGVFLIETGLEVSRGLKEEGFQYDLATLKLFFESWHVISLWTLPLFLAVLLRVITHFFHHQLIFPTYFFIIPIVFYIIIGIGGWSFEELREWGWVFDVGAKKQEWWKFYTLFDFGKTNWGAFWAAMPTQLALVFFGILHVPLNVPALGVSLAEDNVNLDRELTAHGYTNLAAGALGVVPNYLCYVNTVLFYRIGGGSRLSGLMLAAATSAILVIGPTMIGYLPITLVGALIYVLGIDLLLEAVWDTRNKTNRMEYITIVAIAIGMTVWDFVIGLLFGIILACIFFVVQSSRRRPIRAVFDGSTAKSTVRRPRTQRAFIQQVGKQTCVMKLQGFLFFGTITVVEDEIRKLLDLAIWQHNPIRFLVIDFKLVYGLDFSSAEAFVRIQRLLAAKDVMLIMCGAKPDGVIATALQGVGLWTPANRDGQDAETDGGQRIEVFSTLNDALEWSENAYLTAFYEQQAASDKASEVESDLPAGKRIDFPKVKKPPFSLAASYANSPRRAHLARAGGDTLYHYFLSPEEPEVHSHVAENGDDSAHDHDAFDVYSAPQPLPLLVQTFASYPDSPPATFYTTLARHFVRRDVSTNEILWRQGEPADALYIIEAGSLRATYAYHDDREWIQETMVAGTVAGDLSMLSGTARNATVVVERPGTLWALDEKGLKGMYADDEEKAREFVRVVMKAVAEEHDVLSSHLIAVLS